MWKRVQIVPNQVLSIWDKILPMDWMNPIPGAPRLLAVASPSGETLKGGTFVSLRQLAPL